MTIKIKILVPMVILTIIAAGAVLISNIVQFSTYVDTAMEDRNNAASAVGHSELELLETKSSAASLAMAEDLTLIAAMENLDRNVLLARAKEMQAETGVEFCTITDAEGIVIGRSHEPQQYGDSVTAQDNVRAALSGRSLTAIEQGTAVRLSVRSGAPVYDGEDRIIGVVSTGFRLDTDTFVDSVKALLNCEVTVFLGDERISTTVTKEDGTRAVGTTAASNVSQTVLVGNAYDGRALILNQEALAKYSPIYGPDGKVLGMLFVGHYMTEKTDTVWSFVKIGLFIILVLLAVSVPCSLFIAGRIVEPINVMVEAAEALALGNTEINVNTRTRDETEMLANAFNEMIENTQNQVQLVKSIADGDLTVSIEERSDKDVMNKALKSMLQLNNNAFSQIVASANQVSSGARQMADTSQALARGATEQSATVQELSAAICEMDGKTKESAAMADEAASLANNIKRNAERGTEQMERMVRAVKEISEASLSINKIIKVIDDIAFQTNILALNAAVEAARAGEHGKGFAVVADEVRNLAAKSAEAANDTNSLIENSMEKAELGVRIADETAASLNEIVAGINESNRIVGVIASSSEQQSAAITNINDGINQVAQVVQQNSANAEESAAVSEEMNGQAEFLQRLVSQFKLN